MRILAFTDLHGNEVALAKVLEKARVADLIIFAGDLNHHGADAETLLARLVSSKKPILIVHGNWDEENVLFKTCELHEDLHFLHRGMWEMNGVKFLGHGGGGFSREDKDFKRLWNKFFKKQLKPGDKSVLITHAPPYGTKADTLYGEPRGNKTYREFLEKHQPLYHVCGHFHENFGVTDKVDKTTVINPGPKGTYIDIDV